uniref:Candidate secreted effector n=1 Tax=Meloidogyne incognita TaxID=6306 RepID=A0A914MRS0_MELIC
MISGENEDLEVNTTASTTLNIESKVENESIQPQQQKQPQQNLSKVSLFPRKNFGILNRKQMGQNICQSKELVELSRNVKKFSCGLIQGLRYRPSKIEKP